jgi:hypothetical protein
MLRGYAYLLVFLCVCFGAPCADAQAIDPYFDQDLRSATADPRYAHLATATEKVRVYRLHNFTPADWDTWDPTFRGTMDAAAAAKLRSAAAAPLANGGRRQALTSVAVAAPASTALMLAPVPPLTPAEQSAAAKNAKPATIPADDTAGQWVAYLRKDFSDLYSINSPNIPADSTGATLSYSLDQVARNSIWSGEGALFTGYNYLAPQFGLNGQPYILGFTAGPYYTWNATFNSNRADASKNNNVQTAGAAAELATGNFLGVDDFFEFTRVAVGETRDYVKNTSSLSVAADFIPVYQPLRLHYPIWIKTFGSSQLGIRFDPDFRIQYDSLDGGNKPLLLSNRTDALRIGPQVGIWLRPFDAVPYLENTIVNAIYHWDEELYSRQSLYWAEVDLTYKFNANVGITASYQNGKNESTGATTNLFKISLSSALDFCSSVCSTGQ